MASMESESLRSPPPRASVPASSRVISSVLISRSTGKVCSSVSVRRNTISISRSPALVFQGSRKRALSFSHTASASMVPGPAMA